jgi:steroid delta-isomerase-like uncharacterized protein
VHRSEENKRIVKRLVKEAWTGKNVGAVDELVSEDYVEYAPFGTLRGIGDYKEGIQMFNSAFPDLKIKVEDMLAEGDRVAFRMTATGTHKGSFMDVPGSGAKVTFSGIDITRIEDGKVVEEWFMLDLMGLMQQLQAKPLASR